MAARKSGIIGVIFHIIMIILTLGLSSSLILSYAATYINPNEFWTLPFFGLAAPFLFLGNILLLLYWAIRWRAWAFIPLLTILAGIGHLSTLVRIPWTKEYSREEVSTHGRKVSVMSYNVQGFMSINPESKAYVSTLAEITDSIVKINPDIICFQEYFTDVYNGSEYTMDSILADWSYNEKLFTIPQFGIAVYSKFRILDSQLITYDSTTNCSMWVDMLVNNDTVRVFNNHLQSTNIDKASVESIEGMRNDAYSHNDIMIGELSARLRDNYRRRAKQVDSVSKIIDSTVGRSIIVCGDFNDTPISYTYRKMRGDLGDSFTEKGRGFHYTYNGLFQMLRIDYIFHSDDLETISYESPKLPQLSDHNPVIAVFGLEPKQ